MSAWDEYVSAETDGTRHRKHPLWSISGEWEFTRDDGLVTAHKMESPHCLWRDTIEWSMALADKHIPLGAPLPDGMRTRNDPNYNALGTP